MDDSIKLGQGRTIRRIGALAGVLLLLVLGISSCNMPDLGALLQSSAPTDLPAASLPSPTPPPSPTPNIPLVQPGTLILWVPPQFDPEEGTTDGDLFNARLDEFISRRPQTEIQIRVKDLAGPYGLLESLLLTESAAPILLPDLVALPRSLMEQAYAENLLMPLDDYGEVLATDEDWFSYSRELASIDGVIAGLPFAGDLLVLAYKNDTGEPNPVDWNGVVESGKALAFPASDPRALVTLAHYQSLGGSFQTDEGAPFLDSGAVQEILQYYQAAQAANVMPYWLTQFETDAQAWSSYLDRQSTLAITWSSLVLGSESPNTGLAPVPTSDGTAFSYADGWVWCVIRSDSGTEDFALELAAFLTDPDYLRAWTLESGYLPVRPSGLEAWTETSHYTVLGQLLPFAEMVPGLEIQSDYGPALRDAVVSVLKDQVEPEAALEVLREEFPE